MAIAVQTKTDGEWMLKEDAAAFLGSNLRSIERLSRHGKIARKYLPRRPNERQARVVYSREDMQAIRNGAAAAATDPVTKQPNAAAAQGMALVLAKANEEQTGAWHDLAVRLASLAELSMKYGPPEKKAWLTFEEAAGYSGLTPGMLEKVIRDGEVSVLGRGRGTWRISRASLDEYGKAGA